MAKKFLKFINTEIENLQQAGLFKEEHAIQIKPKQEIQFNDNPPLINFCSADYLGYTSQPEFKTIAKTSFTQFGIGLGTGPHICGTHDVHKELELTLTDFLQTEDTMLFSSGYLAQLGLFESLLGPDDMVFCDAQVHVGLKEGLRLASADVQFYRHKDTNDLEDLLMKSKDARFRMIVTEGTFSLTGTLAPLDLLSSLATRYDALLVVDESHGLGVLGENGRGTVEHFGVSDSVDLTLSSLSPLIGASGPGYISGRGSLISWLRQKSNAYLFSTALSPAQAAMSLYLIQNLSENKEPIVKLQHHLQWLTTQLLQLGFKILSADPLHPIVSIFMGDAITTQKTIHKLFENGILVTGHCYPLVPKGVATVNLQISSAHTQVALKKLVTKLGKIGEELELI